MLCALRPQSPGYEEGAQRGGNHSHWYLQYKNIEQDGEGQPVILHGEHVAYGDNFNCSSISYFLVKA